MAKKPTEEEIKALADNVVYKLTVENDVQGATNVADLMQALRNLPDED